MEVKDQQLIDAYPDITHQNYTRFVATLDKIKCDIEQIVRDIRTKHIMNNYAKEGWITWEKVSPECPPKEGKKLPNVEPNVSTSSEKRTSTIPLQVPPLHKNATLRVIENPLTNRLSLLYIWEDEDGRQKGQCIFAPEAAPTPVKSAQFITEMHKFHLGDTY